MKILAFLLALLATYVNPILYSDYSDPDVVCVDGHCWMTASSFNCVPGLQVLHSTNLVDWELVSAALPRLAPAETFDSPAHGCGVWAPSIRFNNGTYYIFWGDPDQGIFQVHTHDPAGKWSEPVLVIPGKGLIDPCPLFDVDGKVYLVHAWAKSRCGFNGVLHACELDASCTHAISEDVQVFDGIGTGNFTIEGPKFYRRGDYYYIFAPAGGVKEGWQLVLRSKGIYGPYEWRRVMDQGGTDIHGPHQGAWIDDSKGNGWFFHFEDRYAWGRVVHLQPLSWTVDGWCVIGQDPDGDGVGEPVLEYEAPVPFLEDHSLDLSFAPGPYQWHSNLQSGWYDAGRFYCVASPQGWKNLWNTPNLYLRKLEGPSMQYDACLEFHPSQDGDRAGVVVMGQNYSTLEFVAKDGRIRLEKHTALEADKGNVETVSFSKKLRKNRLYIRVVIDSNAVCTFFFSKDGNHYKSAGEPFAAKEGRWIGAKVGTFAIGNQGTVGWMCAD